MNNREILLNIAAGGDGRTDDWIERVQRADNGGEMFILHMPAHRYPNGQTREAMTFRGTLEHCRGLYFLAHEDELIAAGLLPKEGRTPQQVENALQAIPYTDNGRNVQQPYEEAMYHATDSTLSYLYGKP